MKIQGKDPLRKFIFRASLCNTVSSGKTSCFTTLNLFPQFLCNTISSKRNVAKSNYISTISWKNISHRRGFLFEVKVFPLKRKGRCLHSALSAVNFLSIFATETTRKFSHESSKESNYLSTVQGNKENLFWSFLVLPSEQKQIACGLREPLSCACARSGHGGNHAASDEALCNLPEAEIARKRN